MPSIAEIVKRNVLHDLAPLFQRARDENLWFCCRYQQLWFSPEELAAKQAEGKFLWGPTHWELRSPYKQMATLKKKADESHEKHLKFKYRVKYESHLRAERL